MIFSGDLADKVLSGEKTQTRRPVKYDGQLVKPCQYLPGKSYAIQRKRGTHGLGPRILVEFVDLVMSTQITEGDALAEGFPSTAAFFERWRSFYGDSAPFCWRIVFTLDGNDHVPQAALPPPKSSSLAAESRQG